jgi:isoaspartyl peptidase/L-asparaginase-like protein (Ntn-hydrolase superfamily)
LCGDGALKWAVSQGFEECNGNGVNGKKVVLTEKSRKEWETWMEEKKVDGSVDKKVEKKVEKENVNKGTKEGVKKGVNAVEIEGVKEVEKEVVDDDSHDTVGLICLDDKGRLACGTSTSG